MSKDLLLTAYNPAMAPIGDLTSPLMLAYANRHGMDFKCVRNIAEGEHYWQKIWSAHQALVNEQYERVMWADSDLLITNPEWTPPWTSGFHASLDWGVDATDDTKFSACGFVVCADETDFIVSVAQAYEQFKSVDFPEQMAMRHYRPAGAVTHPRRVFNAVPKEIGEGVVEPWQAGDFACHLTHVPVEKRVELFHTIKGQAGI